MKQARIIIILCLTIIFVIVTGLNAVPPGKSVVYEGGGAGKVFFNGKDHRGKGNACSDCHPDIFLMKKPNKITMADIYAKKFCGACHNGTVSFDAKKTENCDRCHKK